MFDACLTCLNNGDDWITTAVERCPQRFAAWIADQIRSGRLLSRRVLQAKAASHVLGPLLGDEHRSAHLYRPDLSAIHTDRQLSCRAVAVEPRTQPSGTSRIRKGTSCPLGHAKRSSPATG